MDDDKGTTRVLCQSDKGKKIIHDVMNYAVCKEVSPDILVKGVKEMFESVELNEKRQAFFHDANSMDGKMLFEKYYPITLNVIFKTNARKILLKTGLYRISKILLNKVRGR